ncbi:efflux transporter outer membrane subunit [Dyella choica]|uniref:Efflux transporter outer membrane subunit n=1 Tax=Dyella choica TaxID=1927959 RepID=A0A3S0Q6E0_9GAMM|nr:efflux transporter outer membrane subunit [Dyella choica]RUL78417.1 efflux transporter outer membrane subunit [Dyella choica]
MKTLHTALAASVALLLGGCMVGPDYHRPQLSVPTKYKELPGWMAASPDADAAPKGDWWTVFNDPELNQWEPMVSVSNQTVQKAYANYQEALASVQVARAALFPTLGITGSAAKQRSSGSSTFGTTSSRRAIGTSGSLEGNASWVPDLWGKVRRQVEENKATAQASQATLADTSLSEQILLANAVIELRISDADINLLRKTVDAYTESLRVVENQGAAGTARPSDVITARTQLESARSNLIALGVARAQYAHAITVLLGKNPEELDIPPSTSLPALPTVPVVVPSALLQRRPDIAVAERQVAAQNAAIGVAVAAYYPDLSLSAADGFSQAPLAGLLHVANHVWSLGAGVSETVLDFGARHGQVAAARATYEAAIANYRGTVLNALEDVENDLSDLRILAQQAQVQDALVRDASQGAQIALDEYQAGTSDYTTVAAAQASQLSAQQSSLSILQQRLLDTVSLIGDMGGGWSADQLNAAQKSTIHR